MTSLLLLSLVSAGVIADDAPRTRGAQVSLLYAHTAQELDGVQLTVGLNFADGPLRGVQLAGLTNFAADAAGVQLAFGWNVAYRMRGVQVAILNHAAVGRGVQLGLYNFADQMTGVQAGFYNAAPETRGLQIGIVNMSGGGDGETLGLLNFVRGGIHGVALYTSDTTLTNLALKTGGRHLYTTIIVGNDPARGTGTSWKGWGIGVGWRAALGLGPLTALEIEASTMRWIHSLRAQALIRLFGPLSVLAGGGANLTTGMTARVYASFVAGTQLDW